METLDIIIQEILNCPSDSKLKKLTIDYVLINQSKANEMAFKELHNVEHFFVRIHDNTNQGFQLLRNNVLQHHLLPSYKIRHLKVYTRTLSYQCCEYIAEILPFIEIITVGPFAGYLYVHCVIDYCKGAILSKIRTELASKIDAILLQDWKLHNGSKWVVRSDFDMNDRKEVMEKQYLL